MKVDIITMGCSKNMVDSRRLESMLAAAGYDCRFDPADDSRGNVVVINTCGFIGDAKEESVNAILSYAAARTEGSIEQLIVMGCLSERYRKELTDEIPEVDRLFGKFDWAGVVDYLREQKYPHSAAPLVPHSDHPGHSAYIKIAEGCNRFCAFCAIPLITGRYHSRPMEEIEAEVARLVANGVKEFNIIAQDLSAYGEDIYRANRLAALIDRLADIDGVEWIRLHYAYPAGFPMELLDVMARRDNVCKYLDIALQHIADPVLTNMRRRFDAASTRALLKEIRRRVPGIHIRTTMMVGFPGEGEKEFEELLAFVAEERFERLGAFAYCEEEDTYAARNYADDIPADVKQQRLDRLMALQEEISLETQQQKVGRKLRVIIDREDDEFYVGRTEWDSPEVDPEVLVRKTIDMVPGRFYTVKVTDAMPFELIADAII